MRNVAADARAVEAELRREHGIRCIARVAQHREVRDCHLSHAAAGPIIVQTHGCRHARGFLVINCHDLASATGDVERRGVRNGNPRVEQV